MNLFGKIKKPAPAKNDSDLDSGIPSVNKKAAGSKIITIAGLVFALIVAVVGLYVTTGEKKNEGVAQGPKKEKAIVPQAVRNEMPELDLKPEAPEPIEVNVPKERKVPAPESGRAESGGAQSGGQATPIDVAMGNHNQPTPISWFDRKRLSGSKQEADSRSPARAASETPQAAEDDVTPAQEARQKASNGSCAPGEDCAAAPKKSSLAARLEGPASATMIKASMLPNRDFLITLGTTLDASLDFAIDSTQPGIVKATLSRDVRGANGHVVLLEKGTVLTGESQGDLKQGQARIFIRWLRAETQNGVVVSLNSPSADSLGRAGLDGYVDTKFGDRFGAAILISLIKDTSTAIAQRGQSGGGTFVFGNTANAGDKVVEKSLEGSVNIPPVLTKNQGEHIDVIVAFDIDFSTVYKLKARKQ